MLENGTCMSSSPVCLSVYSWGSDLGSLTVGSLFFPLAHSFSQSSSQVVTCLPTKHIYIYMHTVYTFENIYLPIL